MFFFLERSTCIDYLSSYMWCQAFIQYTLIPKDMSCFGQYIDVNESFQYTKINNDNKKHYLIICNNKYLYLYVHEDE